MLADVCSSLFLFILTWSFALDILQMRKGTVSMSVILKKKSLRNPGILGSPRGTWTPLPLENGDNILENLSPLAQIPWMKLLCKKQVVIYINNIKIIIIN